MWKKVVVNLLLVLAAVKAADVNPAAASNSKIVCYYDSRAFAKEGKTQAWVNKARPVTCRVNIFSRFFPRFAIISTHWQLNSLSSLNLTLPRRHLPEFRHFNWISLFTWARFRSRKSDSVGHRGWTFTVHSLGVWLCWHQRCQESGVTQR